MPLTDAALFGTNKDQTVNEEYCVYCYKDGAFTQDMSMDEMIELCVPFCLEAGVFTDADAARAAINYEVGARGFTGALIAVTPQRRCLPEQIQRVIQLERHK